MGELISAIPKMTSDTSPSGVARTSDVHNNDNFYGAWKVFDGNSSSIWRTNFNVLQAWISYEFQDPKIINHYKITVSSSFLSRSPKDWTFEGSNDGNNWTILDTQVGVSFNSENNKNFEFTNDIPYKIYKINFTASNGGDFLSISELNMYEVLIQNKTLIKTETSYLYYSPSSGWNSLGSAVLEQNYLDYGMDDLSTIPQSAWQELTGTVELCYYTDDTSVTEAQFSIETEPFTLSDELGESFSVVEYTDNPFQEDSIVTAEAEPYSVYDYISETPEVLVYTDLKDDIVVETTTEAFDLYDEFGNSVDVLYYTDDTEITEADLILEANWSPVDELEGDFEVVTWTDESSDTAQRALEMTAIPKPQFIKLINPKRLYGFLEDIIVNDISMSYRDEARYFFADTDTTKWYIYDTSTKSFVLVDTSTQEAILQNGMKFDEVNALEYEDWSIWGKDWLNIGVFLKDNPRDTITSIIDNMTYKDFLPRNTASISETSLYILNTTARIDLTMLGNTVEGVLSDDDLTRVQYRVLLNGENFYPEDGSFTKLSNPPKNISITIPSSKIIVDKINTVKVEFRDYFGTTDYWQANFIGTYSGLLFKDVYGEYYSNEIGEVLKYLDFGIIIAGQTTVEHEIILKNTYGYDVKNIQLFANTSNFPKGMKLEFSESLAPFTPKDKLSISSGLKNNEELSFYVRLKTELGSTPDANGSFDIIVKAEKA